MKRLVLFLASALAATAYAQEPPPPPPYAPPPPYYGQPQPVRYLEQRRWGLFEIGCGVFGGAYLGTLYDALNEGRPVGAIPVAGAFLLVDDSYGTGTNTFLVLDGVAQAAGLTLMILGVTLTKKVPVYAVVPTGTGLAVAGRF